MKAAVEKTNRPEVVGGLGGFAGLFALDTAKYRTPAAGVVHRRRRHEDRPGPAAGPARHRRHRPGRDGRRRPGRLRRRAAVPPGLRGLRQGRARADRRDRHRHRRRLHAGRRRPGRRRDRRARRPDGRRRVRPRRDGGRRGRGRRRPRARSGCAPATSSSRWRRPASTPTATRWSAGSSPPPAWTCTATPAGLDRPLGEELLEPTRIYAQDCLALVERARRRRACTRSRTSPAAGWPATPRGSCPTGLEAVLDRGTWALPAAVRLMEEHGVPRTESERAFNCGVGMVAAVAADVADAVVAQLTAARRPGLGGRGGPRTGRRRRERPPGEHLPLTPAGLSAQTSRRPRDDTAAPARHCGVGSLRPRGSAADHRGLAAQSSSASSSAQRSAYSSSSSSSSSVARAGGGVRRRRTGQFALQRGEVGVG